MGRLSRCSTRLGEPGEIEELKMLRIYFDTNVYDHIDKDDVPMTDLDALRSALANRKLVANLSIADVEELLGQWETNRPAAIRKLQLARDLVGFDQILKQPSDLLADAFKAYASGEAAASYLMPPDQRRVVASSLHRVIQGDPKLDRVISESLGQMKRMTKGFRQMMTESRAEVLTRWKIIVANLGRNPTTNDPLPLFFRIADADPHLRRYLFGRQRPGTRMEVLSWYWRFLLMIILARRLNSGESGLSTI